jgi:hypothetical protein
MKKYKSDKEKINNISSLQFLKTNIEKSPSINLEDLISGILLKKKDRNLIIFNNNYDIIEFKKKNKLENWLQTSANVSTIVYYGNAYNPPYFNNIISLITNNFEDVQKIWNMTLYEGSFIVSSNFYNFFEKYVIKKSDNNILVKKKINITYQFPKWKVLDFMIAGTMKGGTTSALKNFYYHPEISMPKINKKVNVYEEIHYFNDIKKNYLKGVEWYKQHFDYSKKMIGDKSPDIMYQSLCLDLLQMLNPQVKIILFLRNPIDRAYSHWKMLKNDFNPNISSFEFCVEDELKNRMGEIRNYSVSFWTHLVQRGLYYSQIENILKYFPRENIYIAISEKVRKDMDKEYDNIFKFLNIQPFKGNYTEEYVSKSSDTLDINSKIYKKLKKTFNKDKVKLENFLGYKTEWW